MKKFFILFAFFIASMICLTQSASAEKIQWKDPDFDFKSIRNIYLDELSLEDPKYDDFITDEGAENKMEAAVKKALSQKKISLSNPKTDSSSISNQAIQNKLGLSIKAYSLGKERVWHEAWVEKKPIARKISILDTNGEYVTISVPDTIVIEHPRRHSWISRVDIEFIVTNLKENKIIYTLRDSRSVKDYTSTGDILKRIANGFAKDISKN